jgi:hypothetical protein
LGIRTSGLVNCAIIKKPDNQNRNLNKKNIIGDGTKNFRKYQLAVWLSIQNFYEKRKFQDVWKSEFLWLIIYDYSSDVMSCDVCRMAGPDIAGKTEFVNASALVAM